MEYKIINNEFFYLKKGIVNTRIIRVLKKYGEMSISELKRKTKSSDKVTWWGVKELQKLGIVKLNKKDNEKYHPVIVKLSKYEKTK